MSNINLGDVKTKEGVATPYNIQAPCAAVVEFVSLTYGTSKDKGTPMAELLVYQPDLDGYTDRDIDIPVTNWLTAPNGPIKKTIAGPTNKDTYWLGEKNGKYPAFDVESGNSLIQIILKIAEASNCREEINKLKLDPANPQDFFKEVNKILNGKQFAAIFDLVITNNKNAATGEVSTRKEPTLHRYGTFIASPDQLPVMKARLDDELSLEKGSHTRTINSTYVSKKPASDGTPAAKNEADYF